MKTLSFNASRAFWGRSLRIFVALIGIAALWSCKETKVEEEDTFAAKISFSTSDVVELGSEANATGRLIFSCDHDWKLESPKDADWVSCDQTSGKGAKMITLRFTAKENTGSSRSATFTIVSGASSKKFTVKQAMVVLTLSESDVENLDKIYQPAEFNFDMMRSDSKWSYCRSKQSEHFIVFWDRQYGEYGLYGESKMGVDNTSPSTAKSSSMRVDIDDLLAKAEMFYDVNINQLKFADTSEGKSVLNKHKMMIFILYQSEWLATGSGYDNEIGALWVNPSTCQPVGSTIAHEIGHSFQYMVYCDYLLNGGVDDGHSGWRYGYGENGAGGNGFWEQTAQWQSFQTYKAEAFDNYYFQGYIDSTHLHVLHEDPRYSNYFIHWWWVEKYGLHFIGELWRAAVYPEDPCQTYMRMNDMDVAAFNDDMWLYAAHMVTWDCDEIREYGKNRIGAHTWNYTAAEDGYYRVAVNKCPETTGYNVIRLNTPAAGTVVKVDFKGLTNVPGYNCGSAAKAGWRYGFVAYMNDGTTDYGTVYSDREGVGEYTVPSGCERLWLVVTGAPVEYEQHPWDDDSSNDAKYPYQVKFSGTDLYGNITFDGTETPHDEDFVYDVEFAFDSSAYSGTTVEVDIVKLAKAFVMQPSEIKAKLGSSVKFIGVNADGSEYSGYTANGYGHWFDADGNVCNYGKADSSVFSEFNEAAWTFSLGQYPGRCQGKSFTVRQKLVYENGGHKTAATFTFNISVK